MPDRTSPAPDGAYSVSFAGWKDSYHRALRQSLRNCDDKERPTPAHVPTVRVYDAFGLIWLQNICFD